MTTLRTIAALIFALVLASSATALADASAPQLAADSNRRVDAIQQSLVSEGFALQEVQAQPIYYFRAPGGVYNWGTLVYTFTRAPGGIVPQAELVTVTVQVMASRTGFTFPQISISE